jgi:hypothetical protein
VLRIGCNSKSNAFAENGIRNLLDRQSSYGGGNELKARSIALYEKYSMRRTHCNASIPMTWSPSTSTCYCLRFYSAQDRMRVSGSSRALTDFHNSQESLFCTANHANT